MKIVKAFAPAHVTGLFVIYEGGSTGAGINLDEGAITEVELLSESKEGNLELAVNNLDIKAPVSYRVLESYQSALSNKKIRIKTETSFPVGFGVGMSGAGSFSLSLALNKLLETNFSYKECMEIAAKAEIHCGTGLGTVMTQQYFGFMIGEEPYPSKTAEIIPCEEDTVVCAFMQPIETGKIIRDAEWKKKINQIGLQCMKEIVKDKTIKKFIELSRHFTLETGLASSQLVEIMQIVPQASMAMLGQTLFAVVKSNEANEIKNIFDKFANTVKIVKLGTKAASII